MSYKELAIQLINNMPDYKLGYAIAYLQGLVDEYKNDTEKDDVVSFEEAAKMCGVPASRRSQFEKIV